MTNTIPVLYSFRRCPYAMRARLAIANARLTIELREVKLRNKPAQLLALSPKGTVPVLLLNDGTIIEESLDIMYWALSQNDINNWLEHGLSNDTKQLIQYNDGEFKYYLDRYKYADRYPEHDEYYYRQQAEIFIAELEQRLSRQAFLCGENCSVADIATFPFIRQFASVNNDWFRSSKYQKLQQWLDLQLSSDLFISVMKKYPAWQAGDEKSIVQY